MKTLFPIFLFLFATANMPAADLVAVLKKCGFSENDVIGISFASTEKNWNIGVSLKSSITKKELFQIFENAKVTNVRSVNTRYAISLFTGSSSDSQTLTMFTDETGAIYFKDTFPATSKNDPIWTNPLLFKHLYMTNTAEQGAAANP